jgi:glycosyltransferase involved in cell wall biosynthesis
MFTYKDYGKIGGVPYQIEISSQSNLVLEQKAALQYTGALQSPFDDFHLLAQSFKYSMLDRNSKLIVRLEGPPHFFYFLLKKIDWYFGDADIEFDCSLNEEKSTQGKDFMIAKMSSFVLAMSEKNSFKYSYLFCRECSSQKKSFTIDTKPGIDFVVPVKNTDASDLMTCLESLEPQVEALDRVYLVDDNDFPTLDAESFKKFDFNFEVIRGPSQGIAAARNIGAKSGFNPLVLFVDSDDYVLPGFVSKQRKFHIQQSEIGATGTWLQAFGSHERVFPQWDNISPLSVLSCLPPAGILMWKREALEELDYFDPLFQIGFEDFDLVARATVRNTPIIVLDEILYKYRRGHSSLSQNWNFQQELALRNAVNVNLKNLCSHDFKSFLSLNTKFGQSIFQANPDYVFIKQEPKPFKNLAILVLIYYFLPKNLRSFLGKFFPRNFRHRLVPTKDSDVLMRIRQNGLIGQVWIKLPRRAKLFFFKRYFSRN